MPIDTRSRLSLAPGGNWSSERLKRKDRAMSFYLKKTYVDNEPGIELVNIHYTWTPMNTPPNWETHRETRMMPRGGTLIRGMGGTTLDEHGQSVQTTTDRIELPDDGVRRKFSACPRMFTTRQLAATRSITCSTTSLRFSATASATTARCSPRRLSPGRLSSPFTTTA